MDKEKQIVIIDELIERIVSTYNENFSNNPSDIEKAIDETMQNLLRDFFLYCAILKDDSFSEEKEWRLISE